MKVSVHALNLQLEPSTFNLSFLQKKILFLTLRVFSATGGIEKVCRVVGKALYELGLQYGGLMNVYSMYGSRNNADGNKYFPQLAFRGFDSNKVWYVLRSIRVGRKCDIVIMSHINLLTVGYLIKKLRPSVKLILLAHGIEVWKPYGKWKRRMMNEIDLILPVSRFTEEKMISLYDLPEEKFSVFNNCLEPFLEMPLSPKKSEGLLKRYGLQDDQRILLTVSRMEDSEQYKGYDKVLQALPNLVTRYPNIRYLLIGKYDQKEKKRLDKLIDELHLQQYVVFSGFVQDEEMPDHFNLGDLFIMPSEKEGFGIVFIEAMYYGLPVIAGNKDGSVDALWNGELGLLVNPGDIDEISTAITKILDDRQAYLPNKELLHDHFSYAWYKRKLRNCLNRINN